MLPEDKTQNRRLQQYFTPLRREILKDNKDEQKLNGRLMMPPTPPGMQGLMGKRVW